MTLSSTWACASLISSERPGDKSAGNVGSDAASAGGSSCVSSGGAGEGAAARGEFVGSNRVKAPINKTAPAPMASNKKEAGRFRVFMLQGTDAWRRAIFN